MERAIGVLASEHITTVLVTDNELRNPIRRYPPANSEAFLAEMPVDAIVACIATEVQFAADAIDVKAVGVGVPGIIRNGVVEDCPNLPQMKGSNLKGMLSEELRKVGRAAPVAIFNDAEAIAAGIAARVGRLDRMIRVWTLGDGIGFGRYPRAEGIWEGGHMVVSLDPKENYCGCGGIGHVEGIMGHRAMRLRFLDLEPEEVFAKAASGDSHCEDFVKLWHRALAAACSDTIHLHGHGNFFITGPNARLLDLVLLGRYVEEMVTMSPLQGSSFQIMETGDEIGALGAAIDAEIVAARTDDAGAGEDSAVH